MASAKQIAANRANSKKSTGPTSAAGKTVVSENRTTHGLCGQFSVLPCESQADYDALLAGFMESEQPANPAEKECVVRMAKHHWMANRALRMQDSSFTMEPRTGEQKEAGLHFVALTPIPLQHAMRYYSLHDRAYQRAWKELSERRKQRQLAEIGFERKKHAEADQKRKAEKHQVHMDTAILRQQLTDLKLSKTIATALPSKLPKEPALEAALNELFGSKETKVGA